MRKCVKTSSEEFRTLQDLTSGFDFETKHNRCFLECTLITYTAHRTLTNNKKCSAGRDRSNWLDLSQKL